MKLLKAVFFVATFLAVQQSAGAQDLGALQVLIGSKVDANLRKDVADAVGRAGSSGKWSWTAEARVRQQIPQGNLDCFTPECLKSAGAATRLDGGVRVRLNGEAEIFDWTVDVYDLHTGELAATKTGSCELCGVAEVARDFEASVRAALASAKISTPKANVAKPKPVATKPAPRPEAEPERKPEDTVTDAGEPTSDDPAAGLVMLEVVATPDDAIISMGGQQIGVGAVTISVEPGTYEILFAREGYGGLREQITISPNSADRAFLRVHLPKTDPDAVYVSQEGPMDRLGQKRVTYGLVGLGSGAVLLATGAWLGAIDGRPTCDGAVTTCARVRETSAAAFLTTAAGAVLATGGAAFLVWDVLSGKTESDPVARVVPTFGEGSAGLGLVGRF